MKEIFKAEFSYLRTRYYWAMGFAVLPMAILIAIVNPLIGGKVPFDEAPFVSLMFFWSVFMSSLFLLQNKNNDLRTDLRTRLHIMLPMSRLKLALVHHSLTVFYLISILAGWWLMFAFTGFRLDSSNYAGLLLMNAIVWSIVSGVSMYDRLNKSSIWFKIGYNAVWVFIMLLLIVNTHIGRNLFKLLEFLPVDVNALADNLKSFSSWINSMQGATTAIAIALFIPIISIFQFTQRRSFIGK